MALRRDSSVVERSSEEAGVGGPIPSRGTRYPTHGGIFYYGTRRRKDSSVAIRVFYY